MSDDLDADGLRALSLSQLFDRALAAASDAHDLPSNADATQDLLRRATAALALCQTLLRARGVFSANEGLDDVSSAGLPFMLVDFVAGEAVGRLKTTGRADRLQRLAEADANFQSYIALLDAYSVVPASERAKLRRSGTADPARRREEKIAQFRWEKDVRDRLRAFAERQPNFVLSSTSDDFALVRALLPGGSSSSRAHADANDAADDDEEGASAPGARRQYVLALLSVLYAHALSQVESIAAERALLESVPDDVDERGAADGRTREREEGGEGDRTWKLDRVDRGGPDGKGPLMDPTGKPMRPFTILPSGGAMDDRARLQDEVFRAGHRLPTMSIDEYLKNEWDTGRVITGGGQASADAPTTNEILELAMEQDGTAEAAEAAEAKRLKDESWAVYTEENAKGAGNTMNRG